MLVRSIKKLLSEGYTDTDKVTILSEINDMNFEVSDIVDVIKYIKKFQAIDISYPDSIDIVSTGWSMMKTINTSTLTAFLLAKNGYQVLKHGSNASTSNVGSFDLLASLWTHIPQTAQEIQEEVQQHNIAFLYARLFFPIFKTVANARKQFWKPTIFNILWPLLSPANPLYQMIWCAFKEKQELLAHVVHALWRKKAYIVTGDDGLDEVTLTWQSTCFVVDGSVTKKTIQPSDYWFSIAQPDEIIWGDINYNTSIALSILDGTCTTRHADLVMLNYYVAKNLIS